MHPYYYLRYCLATTSKSPCVRCSPIPSILSRISRYLCSQCDSLQDATRYTELRELPPVLHFSLLRFVYDVSSMERKKSKHVIKFPKTLDMSRYLGTASNRKAAADHKVNENLYELVSFIFFARFLDSDSSYGLARSFAAQRCQRVSRALRSPGF